MKINIVFAFLLCLSCDSDVSLRDSSNQGGRARSPLPIEDIITDEKVERYVSDTQISGLSCSILKVTESKESVEIEVEFTLKESTEYIYESLILSFCASECAFSVPFHNVSTGESAIVKMASIKISLDKSSNLFGEERPFLSISGSVSENLGGGVHGKSSSIYSVWDLLGK